MAPRPPSLRAVSAFESAARHQSFTRAAEELHLTHSAISHAVRGLEERLGVELFDRVGRRVILTAAGRTFVERVRSSLSILSDALEVEPRRLRNRLTVSACPGFAEQVLVRRLDAFRGGNPQVQIELRCRGEPPTLSARGDIDIAIQYSSGSERGVAGRLLAAEVMMPVAAASFGGRVLTLRDLAGCPLLEHVEAPWRDWAGQVATRPMGFAPHLVSDDWTVLIEAAKAGHGVLLARSLLVAAELEAGSLIGSPIGAIKPGRAYYLLWDPGSPKGQLIETFADWLEMELQSLGPSASLGQRPLRRAGVR